MTPADLVCDHGEAPAGVSPVVAAFLRLHADWLAKSGILTRDDFLGLVTASATYDTVALADGVVRSLDIPEDAMGGDTLGTAFVYLDHAQRGRAQGTASEYAVHTFALTAASLAGEALREWSLAYGEPCWTAQNHPYSILLQASMWARSHG